jgi:integrase/recombinase XerD
VVLDSRLLADYLGHLAGRRRRDGQPVSIGTRAIAVLALRGFGRWLARTGALEADPALELEVPRRPWRLPRRVLNSEEMDAVLAVPDRGRPVGLRNRAILEVFYSTGLRRGELVHLELEDIDRERGTLLVRHGKGDRDRVVPIGDRALGWLDTYLRDVRPRHVRSSGMQRCFVTVRGNPLGETKVSELVAAALRRAGFAGRGSCHFLRHTMATLMLENGADVRVIQEMLGHKHLGTTALYTHVAIGHLKRVHRQTHPAERLVRSRDAPRLSCCPRCGFEWPA